MMRIKRFTKSYLRNCKGNLDEIYFSVAPLYQRHRTKTFSLLDSSNGLTPIIKLFYKHDYLFRIKEIKDIQFLNIENRSLNDFNR